MIDRCPDTCEPALGFGPPELAETLLDLLSAAGETGARFTSDKLSGSRVHRVRMGGGRDGRSFVVKRFSSPNAAQCNQLVSSRWFPAVGLADAVPRLLGIAAERSGRRVWHIYEDLGDCTLASSDEGQRRTRIFSVEPERIEPAVRLIGQIHARFASHPLLAECRHSGRDFGGHFFVSALDDGLRALDALLAVEQTRTWTDVICRLRAKLHDLRRQQAERLQALARFAAPETLLHGDLWPINVMVSGDGRAALIDWDHVGVGPVTYDLSTFLAHFPPERRRWILDLYLRSMDGFGIRFPEEIDWNLLFETAEDARLATSVAFAALSALYHPEDWAFEDLARIDEWFDRLEPILPLNCAEVHP